MREQIKTSPIVEHNQIARTEAYVDLVARLRERRPVRIERVDQQRPAINSHAEAKLLHEFKQRIGKGQAFILTGSCSPDGQQTPFLPYIEVVRGAFQVRLGEAENEVVRKLQMGLTVLGLSSPGSLGLLLNMLGLKPPEGTLTGLDGVLIGLRTRHLLQILLEARCRLSPVILLIEDLHWIDSVSQEVLGKMVSGDTNLRLMILHTRRPEYAPTWVDLPILTELGLEPLLASDIRRLVQARLGVEALPEALARLITEKSEGNPLFAEEIVSFLTERGVLRAGEGKVVFDANAVATALVKRGGCAVRYGRYLREAEVPSSLAIASWETTGSLLPSD